MKTTYLIPECNLAELEARVAKLNRRADRLGVEPITLTKRPDHTKARVRVLTVNGEINSRVWMDPGQITEANQKWPHEDTGERMVWWAVEVAGKVPTYKGWSFVAILEPLKTEDEVLNLIRTLPGETCPVEYRDATGRCDHCKTVRKRNETFVVRHQDGNHKCVGRQCLKDFLGYHADPHALAGQAELFAQLADLCGSAEDDEWLGGGGGGGSKARAWDLYHFLTLTACRVRLFGWLSKGKAWDEGRVTDATANRVLGLLTPPAPGSSRDAVREWEKFCDQHVVTEADSKLAGDALDWAKDLEVSETDDYLYNINLVARVGSASRKTAGLAASIIVAHNKAVEKEINRKREANRPVSNHIGEVGKRINLIQITCERVIANEGVYGVTGIHKLTDAEGNDLTWFASSGSEWIKEGKTVWVSLTVKDHGEFKGRKQTVVSRVITWTEQGLEAHRAKEARKAARAAKKAVKS